MQTTHTKNPFDFLGLDPVLLRAVYGLGYEAPTPIQKEAIPAILSGRDVIGTAQTGSGKTAAFLLPILHRLLKQSPGHTRALVLSPTRELAAQIEVALRGLAKGTKIRGHAVYGGVGMAAQEHALRSGVDVVVATPGRLLDHMSRRNVDFRGLQVLVLDEADRMLDMGFLPDVRRIVDALPRERQTLLFSATMAPEIESLSRTIMRNPVRISVSPPHRPPSTIRHEVYPVPQHLKTALLVRLLGREDMMSVLVFVRTKRRADRVARQVGAAGFDVARIHGDRSQSQRETALAGFRSGRHQILVATDVAARGIDVEGISHVINYDVPAVPTDYVHRVGRTARMEAAGEAITFVTPGGLPNHRLRRAGGRRRRADDRVAYHGGFPRRGLLRGGPRGGRRCPRGDMGEGPDRGPRDLAIHHAHAPRHAGTLRQLPLLGPDPERPSRGLVLARDLRRRAGRHAGDRTFATPRTRRRSTSRAPRPDVDANHGARPRRRHARLRSRPLARADHRRVGVAVDPDPLDGAGDRSMVRRDRLRGVPCEPGERLPPNPATGRRLHRLRGLAIRRGCAVCRRRELERSGGVGVPRFPGEHPAGRLVRVARPPKAGNALGNRTPTDALGDETASTSSSAG